MNNKYEKFREEGWKSYEDCANVVSYFCPCRENEVEVSGKIKQLPEICFDKQVDIRQAFDMIKTQMMTKQGKLRKKMVDIPEWEVYAWGSLLHELRRAWQDGESMVFLSWKELKMLKGE